MERIRPMSMAGLANVLGLIPVMWATGTGADVMKRLAAPMVRKFFEGIKEDIKDRIEPPQKANVVFDEDGGSIPQAIPVSEDEHTSHEGFLSPVEDRPLRALPVEPLDSGLPPRPLDASGTPEPLSPRRAIPVYEPEVELVPQIEALPEPGDFIVPLEGEPARAIPVGEDVPVAIPVEE